VGRAAAPAVRIRQDALACPGRVRGTHLTSSLCWRGHTPQQRRRMREMATIRCPFEVRDG
jgi:hypothetical protein